MKSKFVKRNQSKRLIVIFSDWGVDWRPFAKLSHPDCDIVVIWDYTDLSFNWQPYLRYDEICLIAWGIGVFVASVTVHEIAPRITLRLAINGTLTPISDSLGIPASKWMNLLNTLSPSRWRRYKQSICDNPEQYEKFCTAEPKHTMAELKEELDAIYTHTIFHVEQIEQWDMAVIGRNNNFFPPQNQIKAWRSTTPIRMADYGHLPDFEMFVNRLIIDKHTVRHRFETAASDTRTVTDTLDLINRHLFSLFRYAFGRGDITGNVIEVGYGKRFSLTRLWMPYTDPRAKLRLWDLISAPAHSYGKNVVTESCDAEVRIRRQPSASTGFIFSSATVEWFCSVDGFLKECQRVLADNGYLILASFTADNMPEMKRAVGGSLQLPTEREWQKMISEYFEIVEFQTDTITLEFDSPAELLRHLRDGGLNGVSFHMSPVKTALKILRDYPQDEETGKYTVTLSPVYVIARKKCDE
ncbi:MAG: DUF452 family protein [Muribaculaceae bacterium]|nr:DUF452 family protein [Muribaculaceae bacterium]